MKKYTPSKLRENIYRILDDVVATGRPIAIERKGDVLYIVPSAFKSRLSHLKKRPIFKVDPESIVHCNWEKEWKAKSY